MIGRTLKSLGFEIIEASNGQEGLDAIAAKGPFDVALVDWNIPVMDGLDFVCNARSNPQNEGMRIMMVTTETETTQVTRALAAGASEYLTKAFPPPSQRSSSSSGSCRPAVDVLFRSVAKVYGPRVLASVMTGMGHDGTRRARDIVDAGGSLVVQNAATCVVPSMPQGVVDAGLASAIRRRSGGPARDHDHVS